MLKLSSAPYPLVDGRGCVRGGSSVQAAAKAAMASKGWPSATAWLSSHTACA